MDNLKILRLKIYQPQAHYRIPFTYQRRHTYPLPPYSTIIGFLCNLLGYDGMLKDCKDDKVVEVSNDTDVSYDGMPKDRKDLKKNIKNLKISIAGRFKSKTTEYIWFRNLSKDSHVNRFGGVEIRSVGGHIEHIGGQSPISIDVLDEVHLVIHLAHENKDFLEKISSSLENPINRLEILHIGRAEDWIVIEELSQVIDLSNFRIKREDANFGYFFWIPEKIYYPNQDNSLTKFEEYEGLLYRLPTFWTVENYNNTLNRHGKRIFDYISAKLSDGLFKEKYFLFDEVCKIPVFFADFGGNNGGSKDTCKK
jgi:CRISPR-associated protein Cas5t